MKTKTITMIIQPSFLNQWLHQNRAEYMGDFEEGCLLDNFIIQTKRGLYAAIYEKYVNEWQSTYRVEIGNGDIVYKHWDEFCKEYREALGIG